MAKRSKQIDEKEPRLSIYYWYDSDIPISELKDWVDAQMASGKTKVSLDISWGYYNDLDGLDQIAE